jgi:hypothetical protein
MTGDRSTTDPVTCWGGAPPGTRTPNPLILGPLLRLVADGCDDLAISRYRPLNICGRLVLFRCH